MGIVVGATVGVMTTVGIGVSAGVGVSTTASSGTVVGEGSPHADNSKTVLAKMKVRINGHLLIAAIITRLNTLNTWLYHSNAKYSFSISGKYRVSVVGLGLRRPAATTTAPFCPKRV